MFDRSKTALAFGAFVVKSDQEKLRSVSDGAGDFVAPRSVGCREGVSVGRSVGIFEVVG